MSKEYCGLNVIVDNETFNEYKGTLQEQIEELQQKIDKAIKRLNDYTTEYEDIYLIVEDTIKILEEE